MAQVYVCWRCKKEIEEKEKYVVTSKDKQGVEARAHAECEKNNVRPPSRVTQPGRPY